MRRRLRVQKNALMLDLLYLDGGLRLLRGLGHSWPENPSIDAVPGWMQQDRTDD